jgi:invasion protein IalB
MTIRGNAAPTAAGNEVSIVRNVIACVAAAVSIASAAVAQDQQNVTRTPMGDWTKLCVNGNAQCVIEQIGKTAAGEDAMSVQIEKLAAPQEVNGSTVEAVANIRVPLGVVLTQGLRLRIDQGQQSASPYFMCQPNGCLVRAPLQPDLLQSFRRGARAQFSFVVLAEGEAREVPIDISLSGFTRAFDSL